MMLPVSELSFLILVVVGYFLLFLFIAIERFLRKTPSAKTLHAHSSDRKSTLLVGYTFGAGLILPVVLDGLSIGIVSIGPLQGIIAIIMMVLSLGLRVWAARTLGEYYTRTLLTSEGQKVVTCGPYGLVRHPGYLADIVLWSGFGVLTSNEILMILFPLMFISTYLYRISVEEKMLTSELGQEYVAYQKKTRKLLPLIY